MATVYATVRVVVVVDENGGYAAGADEDGAVTAYGEQIQCPEDAAGLRQVVLSVRVPLPTPIELSAEVSCEETATVSVT